MGRNLDLRKLFWKKVDTSGDCWLWTGHVDKDGYGMVRRNKKNMRASRYAVYLATGKYVPPGMVVMHDVCDNPPCVRYSHLKVGTQSENIASSYRKGRSVSPNSGKTSCKRGHPLSGDNLYVIPSTGSKSCLTCKRMQRDPDWRSKS
jgi:hypothetical protein